MPEDADVNARLRLLQANNQMLQRWLKSARDQNRQLNALVDTLYERIPDTTHYQPAAPVRPFDGISFIIVAYNIPRQIMRAVRSASPLYQQAEPQEIEIIIVDNGSSEPMERDDFKDFGRVTKIIRVDGKPSPVFGLNEGVRQARFSNVALMIDGAHILSPGVFRNAKTLLQLIPRPVINVPQYILGRISQNLGTNANAFDLEEADLTQLGWPNDGYALFDYATKTGEHADAEFIGSSVESNCLITTKEVLSESGAFDERFDEPGAGLANIEILTRLRHNPNNEYVMLPGEGSFHQDHSGTTNGADPEAREKLVAEYYDKFEGITGNSSALGARAPILYGVVRHNARRVPTISTAYGMARTKVLKQLAEIYIHRAVHRFDAPVPNLTMGAGDVAEQLKPVLKPSGEIVGKAAAHPDGLNAYRRETLLDTAHKLLKPKFYFEVNVGDGRSMSLANCPSLGVDPNLLVSHPLRAPSRLFKISSDGLFAQKQRCEHVFRNGIDLALINSGQLAEKTLRDFLNIERWSNPGAVVLIEGVLPEDICMAGREPSHNVWCGDGHRVIALLRHCRPDLNIEVYESVDGKYRTGIAVVYGLRPGDHQVDKNIEIFVQQLQEQDAASDRIDKVLSPAAIEQFEAWLRAAQLPQGTN